jgi:hypothetical protein
VDNIQRNTARCDIIRAMKIQVIIFWHVLPPVYWCGRIPGRDVTCHKKDSAPWSLLFVIVPLKSRDSSVGIALGYGLDDRRSRVRLPAGAGNFSLHNRVQNVSGAHPASYPMGARGSFPGGKLAGA